MGWGTRLTEFGGAFMANFMAHRARTKKRLTGSSQHEKDCLPIEDHITEKGKKLVSKALKKNDHFGAQLAIDANPSPNKSSLCIALLKLAVTFACSTNSADMIRAATFNLLK